jgi:hypothetical protein
MRQVFFKGIKYKLNSETNFGNLIVLCVETTCTLTNNKFKAVVLESYNFDFNIGDFQMFDNNFLKWEENE